MFWIYIPLYLVFEKLCPFNTSLSLSLSLSLFWHLFKQNNSICKKKKKKNASQYFLQETVEQDNFYFNLHNFQIKIDLICNDEETYIYMYYHILRFKMICTRESLTVRNTFVSLGKEDWHSMLNGSYFIFIHILPVYVHYIIDFQNPISMPSKMYIRIYR